ncbi:MurR/RpiR family transcriptional regulator [Streptacidiphilus jiangxiensis]|uniref:DNA-binding transcriptional regulator, MurR/RpiR family, contains HTH and SIS domains n=1 Tax=Streptacidiphilus jiangxiensis TaxID=235985 RepID=A0A1H7PLW0_STRJI|nr:MurR/RpiR family transcriptional regulator [Streptacidiphilus jiangxiensis]SEL36599.1 DNA-binding transcriptional regulator, MurR/RpiR family, contains HTH and SIS domains [Streptacidiphilus jiangxiensis]
MQPAPGGVGEAVRLRLGEFSPAERKVARVLLAAYPVAGFETVARLAERAGVSAPTVVRFAQRLGFRGYPEFQQALRDELEEREASPLSLYGSAEFAEQAEAEGGLLARSGRVFSSSVAETFRTLPQDEMDRAIALVADTSRRITVVGGRFTNALASYLCLHLMQMRADCRVLPEAPAPRVAMLAELGRRDVVVALDIRRYESATLKLATAAHTRGATVVLVTDTWLSPVAEVAQVVLPTVVTSPSPYDTLVPAMAVLETVVAGVLASLGEVATARMAAGEQATQELSLF